MEMGQTREAPRENKSDSELEGKEKENCRKICVNIRSEQLFKISL
jgi:hypothetical protein